MTQILELLFQESGDSGQVKAKTNKSGKLRAGVGRRRSRDKAASVASGSSEVMVKISGYGKGGEHAKAHLMYITRHAMADKEKIAIENDLGQLFDIVDDVKQLYQDWSRDIEANKQPGKSQNQRDTMHMILSMPGKNNPDLLRNAVRAFASDAFGRNHEYVFALHTDTDNDHCHLSVKCRGFDGRQLHVPKGQVQLWRQNFAERLREQGIDAEATARNLRGVVRKPEKQVLRHIDDPEPPKGRAPRQSKVKQSRLQEAERTLKEHEPHYSADRPWEAAVRAFQGRTKAAWLKVAQDLSSRPTALETKDGKELTNARIDYSHINPTSARDGQRRGAAIAGINQPDERRTGLYQPGGGEPGQRSPAGPVPSVRDMPVVNVARDQGRAALLLRANARNRLDRGRYADHEVRRQRAGADADAAKSGLSLREQNERLAAQIRRFVARMPEPITAQEALQRQIRSQIEAAKYTQQRAVEPRGLEQGAPVIDPKQGGPGANKDNGRSR